MYCKYCGKLVDDNSAYCTNCGMQFDDTQNKISNDHSNLGFAILGFFIPLVGLILFLVYESKQPKRAKSAGKGALIGFITQIVFSIICVVLCVVFTTSILKNYIPAIGSILNEERTEEIIENYVDVTFGKFNVTNNEYYSDTSLEVTVKNKADTQCTYYITIEAVDNSGARIDTDTICVDRLNSGQEMHLIAFEYVEQEKLEQFKNATFKVLEIDKFNY